MSDYTELVAEARKRAGWFEPSESVMADLVARLADALEAAEAERAGFDRANTQLHDAWKRANNHGVALAAERDEARRIAEELRDELEELSGGQFDLPWEPPTEGSN